MRARLIIATTLAILCSGCVIQPIQLRALQPDGRPVEGVDVYRNTLGWFKIFASDDKPFVSDAEGLTDFTLFSRRTSLTVFKPGFEPRQVIVMPYSGVRHEIRGEGETTLDFDQVRGDVPIDFPLVPVTHTPIQVRVLTEGGEPVEGASVYLSTFIYLKEQGAEQSRGRLPVQVATTGADGAAEVEFISGFMNRVVVRAPDRVGASIELRAAKDLEVVVHTRESRQVRFRVVDRRTNLPLCGAVVSAGQSSDGLPPDADAFSVTTPSSGVTDPITLARRVPLYVRVKAPSGYKDTDIHLEWRKVMESTLPVYEVSIGLGKK
ncbi:MAG: hypothetical protein FJ254_09415 [Phycisphaerae bacterium]|nr:hypothetical protein [Phycisphaerae bacterium]